MAGLAVRVRGIVQGVGFRPYIWHLARQYQLKGAVWNDEQGVMIHVWGDKAQVDGFVQQIPLQLPSLAKILSLECNSLDARPEQDEFRILESRQNSPAQTPITADAATCPACLAEINDPHNRRYRYPFTNCTHCGPRFSVIKRIPYDRCHTSMDAFPLCPACRQEYEDPGNRRFHAQANCCPDCGPRVWLEDAQGRPIQADEAIKHAAKLIQQGQIIAIKGLGGFHLACDAANEAAVARLRQGKKRYAKPFALMAQDVDMIKVYARVSSLEQQALTASSAAIVILPAAGEKLAPGVAMGEATLGFMLPYTPLHALLLQELARPVVMTSGNVSDEPPCIDNDEARRQLGGIADYFLLHNRAIVNRLDDSVMRSMGGAMRLLRRARGFSPEALTLPEGFPTQKAVLAMGAELKNSFCLLKDGLAIVSQHIGDLENAPTQRDYRHQLASYQQLFDFKADVIAVDLHPGYLSTQLGRELAQTQNIPLVPVQHHHAHIAACMAEHGLPLSAPPVLAAVFDGLGMGPEGQLWGGEFLLADYAGFSRLGHFQPIAMPGGVQAIREPWRNGYAQLHTYFDYEQIRRQFADLEMIRLLESKPLAILDTMMQKGLNSPLSSSCGRWFDAFAAALGICAEQVSHEGQAAIKLETLAATAFDQERPNPYPYAIGRQEGQWVLNWKPLWQTVLNDLQQRRDKAEIAAGIHHTLIAATAELLIRLSAQTATDTIVLTGGVFQNRLLLESLSRQLQQQGKTVLSPQQYPMNDGGLAQGQALIAASKQRGWPSSPDAA